MAWFVERQEREGWWRALDPEVAWLTAAIVDWLERAERPFAQCFGWPSAPIWARDRLTGLTTVATLDELCYVFEGFPSLGMLPSCERTSPRSCWSTTNRQVIRPPCTESGVKSATRATLRTTRKRSSQSPYSGRQAGIDRTMGPCGELKRCARLTRILVRPDWRSEQLPSKQSALES
jgi:hypothetical protein